jgi:hypothetical protein
MNKKTVIAIILVILVGLALIAMTDQGKAQGPRALKSPGLTWQEFIATQASPAPHTGVAAPYPAPVMPYPAPVEPTYWYARSACPTDIATPPPCEYCVSDGRCGYVCAPECFITPTVTP